MTSLALVLWTTGLFVMAVLSGRILAGALGVRVLRRFEPAAAAASAAIGVASWTLGFAWLSEAGIAAAPAAAILLAAHLGLVVICWWRGGLSVMRPAGPLADWLGFLGALGVGLALAALPALRTGAFDTCNDTYHYSAFSEWLQRHSWGAVSESDPLSPVTYVPHIFRSAGYPLGAAYLLALAQTTDAATPAMALYPAVSVLGILLHVAAQYLLARWVFRLGEAWAAAAGLGFAVVPHSIYWGHHNGFLQQTFGIAVVLVAIALLARTHRPSDWDPKAAALLALLAAYLLFVYLPMGPPLALAFLPWAGWAIRRASAKGALTPWLGAAATGAALFVGFGYAGLVGLWARLLSFASAPAGGHIPFDFWDYTAFAVGARLEAHDWSRGIGQALRSAHVHLTPLYVAVTVIGVWSARQRPRTYPLLGALASFSAAALYYTYGARDPWSGQAGQTWSLFKLSQYASPLLFAYLVFGLRTLHRRFPSARTAATLAASVFLLAMIPIHWTWSAELGSALRELLPGERPLAALAGLRQRLLALPEGTLLLLGRPAAQHACLGDTLALLAYPRPIVADWQGTVHVPPVAEFARVSSLQDPNGRPATVPLAVGAALPAREGAEDLGHGIYWIQDRGPRVLRLEEQGMPRPTRLARVFEWTGRGRLRAIAFSLTAVRASLELELVADPAGPGAGSTRFVVWTAPGEARGPSLRRAREAAPEQERTLGGGETTLQIPVELTAGITTIAFEARGRRAAAGRDGVALRIAGARIVGAH